MIGTIRGRLRWLSVAMDGQPERQPTIRAPRLGHSDSNEIVARTESIDAADVLMSKDEAHVLSLLSDVAEWDICLLRRATSDAAG